MTSTAEPTPLSATALYNLGNAYARAGEPAWAVLNYERALLLTPGDADIAANLRYVRQTWSVSTPVESRVAHAFTQVDPTVAACLGVLGILIIGACVLAGRRPSDSSRLRWARRAGALCGCALIGLTAGQGFALWRRLHSAVVITEGIPVRASPVPLVEPTFTLRAADTVQILASHDEFWLVRTMTGASGWVPRNGLVPVVPAAQAVPETAQPRH